MNLTWTVESKMLISSLLFELMAFVSIAHELIKRRKKTSKRFYAVMAFNLLLLVVSLICGILSFFKVSVLVFFLLPFLVLLGSILIDWYFKTHDPN